MATCLDLANTIQPEIFKGNKIKKHSGKSLTPIFLGSTKEIHEEPIFWEHEGNKAVRHGDYKLVLDWENNNDNWELYNISNDRTEQNNIIGEFPDIANNMIEMYNEWATKIKVLSWDKINEIRSKK